MRRHEKPALYRGPPDSNNPSQPQQMLDDYSLFTRDKCTIPRTKICLVTIISFVLALAVVLVVVCK